MFVSVANAADGPLTFYDLPRYINYVVLSHNHHQDHHGSDVAAATASDGTRDNA
jgi:hypothetical protein